MPVIETMKKIKRMYLRAAEIYSEDAHRRAQYPDFDQAHLEHARARPALHDDESGTDPRARRGGQVRDSPSHPRCDRGMRRVARRKHDGGGVVRLRVSRCQPSATFICSTRSKECPRPRRQTSIWVARAPRPRSLAPRRRTPARTGVTPPLEDVQGALAKVGYPADRLHYVKGKVEETVPAQAPSADRSASARHRLVRVDEA